MRPVRSVPSLLPTARTPGSRLPTPSERPPGQSPGQSPDRPPGHYGALDLQAWLRTPLGRRVYAQERRLAAEALAQVFGWQMLQIGLWGAEDGLIGDGRTQRRCVLAWHGAAADECPAMIRSRTDALAIASDCIDAVVLPHTMEYEPEPHEILREVERILSGEGHLIVFGFRPLSLWGVRHLFAAQGFPPGLERMISERRLCDWLKLLGFEIVDTRRYLFSRPWGTTPPAPHSVFERAGPQLWPAFGGGYMVKARKRVYALTPVRPRWRLRTKVVGGLIEPTTRG